MTGPHLCIQCSTLHIDLPVTDMRAVHAWGRSAIVHRMVVAVMFYWQFLSISDVEPWRSLAADHQ